MLNNSGNTFLIKWDRIKLQVTELVFHEYIDFVRKQKYRRWIGEIREIIKIIFGALLKESPNPLDIKIGKIKK